MGKKIIAIVFALITSIFFWEIIIRNLIFYFPYINYVYENSITGRRYEPNETIVYGIEGFGRIKTDSCGYNNDHIDSKKQKLRIIALGASNTEALQIERSKNFCSRLMALSNNKVEVVNLGIAGNSITDHILFADGINNVFQPDLVIVELNWSDMIDYGDNDFKMVYVKYNNDYFSIVVKKGDVPLLTKIRRYKKFSAFFQYSLRRMREFFIDPRLRSEAASFKIFPEKENFYRSIIKWKISKLKEKYHNLVLLLLKPRVPNPNNKVIEEKKDPQEEFIKNLIKKISKEENIPFIDPEISFLNYYNNNKINYSNNN